MADSIDRQPIFIETFAARHLDDVARLERECFVTPWSHEGLAEELSNPLAVFRVAVLDGQAVGYAGMHHILDEGYITNIAVSSAHRRKGIGRSLLTELLEYGKKLDMGFLTLEVRVSNAAAIALYASLDFKEQGVRPDFYTGPTEDALIMTYKF